MSGGNRESPSTQTLGAGNLRHLRIGIVAGETSGDILGGRLMAAIKEQHQAVTFLGVGGERMLAEGLQSQVPLEALSVNGFKDPILRLPSLVRILRGLIDAFTKAPVDVVVGVDFNVFNFLLERIMKRRGVPTAHYVSPSVYFWRPGRIRRIRRAADVVLALYPFEPKLYQDRGARAVFVGHPLAEEIEPGDGGEQQKRGAREQLGIEPERFVVALLPGSRRSEIDHLGEIFCATADLLRQPPEAQASGPRVSEKETLFIAPMVNARIRDAFADIAAKHDADIRLVQGNARACIIAADLVLAKSGTATLETLLLGRPMVITYRIGRLTAALVRALKKSDHIGLPNILHGAELVPELVQEDAVPSKLAEALREQHVRCASSSEYVDTCTRIHRRLRLDDGATAAETVLDLARVRP